MTIIEIIAIAVVAIIFLSITVAEIKSHKKKHIKFVYHLCNWYWGKTIKIITNDGLGTIRVSIDDEHPAVAIIDSFSVANEFHGNGYGNILLNEVERYIRETLVNVHTIVLYADKTSWVTDWYKRNGYKTTEETDYEYIMNKKI